MTRPRALLALLCLAGCTVKLKIGAPELSSGHGGPGCGEPGMGCTAPADCCSQICGPSGCEPPDAGLPVDAGAALDAGFDVGNVGVGAKCLAFTDCSSRDCASGQCVDHQDWMCNRTFAFCDTDGGFCFATDAGCLAFSDCCNQDCAFGVCHYSTPGAWLPPIGEQDGGGCLNFGVCTAYFECCSGNCFRGACATTTPFCLSRGACVNYTDCCTYDCDHGQCKDSSLQ